jgi:hypothetical protein
VSQQKDQGGNMETTIIPRKRETDVMVNLLSTAMEGGQINYRKVSKLMRKDGLIGHDEHVVAIEYLPFKITENVRVIVARSKTVNLDICSSRALK